MLFKWKSDEGDCFQMEESLSILMLVIWMKVVHQEAECQRLFEMCQKKKLMTVGDLCFLGDLERGHKAWL